MAEIICQVGSYADHVEFIWSSRGGFFRPYVIEGPALKALRAKASQAREALEKLVVSLNRNRRREQTPWQLSYTLADVGHELYNQVLPDEETPAKVQSWLDGLRHRPGLTTLEVVVEERSADPAGFLGIPWNLLYDELPDEGAFEAAEDPGRWSPFWAIRYNLTSGRRVEPLRREPTWEDPRVIAVIDPDVYRSLREEQRARLDAFFPRDEPRGNGTAEGRPRLRRVESLEALGKALKEGYPHLLYWLGHATASHLLLDRRPIKPGELFSLLDKIGRRGRPQGMLAFLNACQTTEVGAEGSFLDVLHRVHFSGAIATERLTISNFANSFGLDFLDGFLHGGEPLGALLHRLRSSSAPLGLIYGAYCPPEIRITRPGEGNEPTIDFSVANGTTWGGGSGSRPAG